MLMDTLSLSLEYTDTRMKVSDELGPCSSFHRERDEAEELSEKDVSELELFPGELEREESALDTTDQETVLCEEESRKSFAFENQQFVPKSPKMAATMTKVAAEDVNITFEDKQKMNKFARNTSRIMELKEETEDKKKQLQTLQYAVRRAAKMCGLREASDLDDWTLYWTDYSVSLDRVLEMKSYQKINHFPGMCEICRKDLLARNMSRMLKLFPKEFNFFPRTWCLPADYGELQTYSRSKKNKTFICKPDSGCQGRGIYIMRSVKDIKPGEDMICQLYISKPFIIDGFKFDLRIYVLVTSCDPLRIFIYKEGLARFATSAYSDPSLSNLDDVCMHLTNYSINKHSANFVRDDDSGSKRSSVLEFSFQTFMLEKGTPLHAIVVGYCISL
uniref:Tubulin polyglutamylase ttll6 n=1 Tax=Sphaerodactylus townsendi TaxID=933632 RepID=A0ACB8EUI6_9SAUR